MWGSHYIKIRYWRSSHIAVIISAVNAFQRLHKYTNQTFSDLAAVAALFIARTAQKEMLQAARIADSLRAAAFSGGAYVALHMRAGGSVIPVDKAQVWQRLD